MITRAEEDLVAWKNWKKNPSPQNLQILMKRLEPITKSEANRYRSTTITPIMLDNRAQELAFEAIHSYDPLKGQLNTHIITHLQKLNRYAIGTQNSVRSQEKQIFQHRKFLQEKQVLEEELGRPATEQELMSHLGVGYKIKEMRPLVEHYYSMNADQGGKSPVRQDLAMDAVTLALMHQDLPAPQRQVFEYTYGYNKPKLQKQQIAKKLGISNSMVSKHSRKIESQFKKYETATSRMLD